MAILLLALIIAGFTVFLALGLMGKSTATGRSGEKLIDDPLLFLVDVRFREDFFHLMITKVLL